MAFKVRLFSDTPDYETLHVAKLCNFPLEKRDYKPYSQARICFSRDGLNVQLLSFETQPQDSSAVEFVLRLSDECSISLSMYADGHSSIILPGMSDESELPSDILEHRFSGEDLQGVYWGGNISVARARYESSFTPVANATFKGNFYKICKDPSREHYGSFYPADFSKPLNSIENLGRFIIIDY